MTLSSATSVVQFDTSRKRSSVRLGSMETVDALGVETRLFGIIKSVLKYSGLEVSERRQLTDEDADIPFNNNDNNRKHTPWLRRLRLLCFFIISALVK